MALGIDDLAVGVWEHPTNPTGCTVLLPPAGTLGALAVRGQAPGTREAAALGPHGKLRVCHAVVLAGGSAFGLAAADGVVRWLAERGIGYPLASGVVPIVGAAIVLDVGIARPDALPDAAAGRAACDAAVTAEPEQGAVGAGAGATIAKVAGLDASWRGGQGTAVARVGDLVVGALVVNNAVGELVGDDGALLAGARVPADAPRWPRELDDPVAPQGAAAGEADEADGDGGPAASTVIGAVVTNARLDKAAAYRVADLAHDGVARAVEPAHTSRDGDALFCLATGRIEAPLDRVAQLASNVVAQATRSGPLAAVDLELIDHPFGARVPGLASR